MVARWSNGHSVRWNGLRKPHRTSEFPEYLGDKSRPHTLRRHSILMREDSSVPARDVRFRVAVKSFRRGSSPSAPASLGRPATTSCLTTGRFAWEFVEKQVEKRSKGRSRRERRAQHGQISAFIFPLEYLPCGTEFHILSALVKTVLIAREQ